MPPIIQSVLPFLNKISDSSKVSGAEFDSQIPSELSVGAPLNPSESKGFQALAREVSGFLKVNLKSDRQVADPSALDVSHNGVPPGELEALAGKSLQPEGTMLPDAPALPFGRELALTAKVNPEISEDKSPAEALLETRLALEISPISDQSLSAPAQMPSPQGSGEPKTLGRPFSEARISDLKTTPSPSPADTAAIPREPAHGITAAAEQGVSRGLQGYLVSEAPKKGLQNQLAASQSLGPVLSADSGSDRNFEASLAKGREVPLDNQFLTHLSDHSSQQFTARQLTEAETLNQAPSHTQIQIHSQSRPVETEIYPDIEPLLIESVESQDSKILKGSGSVHNEQITKFDFDSIKPQRFAPDALNHRTANPGESSAKEGALGSAEGLVQDNMNGFKVFDAAQLRAEASGMMASGKNASAEDVAASLLAETKGLGSLSGSNNDLGFRSLPASGLASPALSSPFGLSTSLSAGSLRDSLVQQALQSDVTSQNWGGEVSGRIRLMMSAGISQAQMELNPAELGRIDVLLSSEGDSTKLSIVVQSAMAKEALDLQLPRLRDALAEQGISLDKTSVEDQSQQGSGAGGNAQQGLLKGNPEDESWDKEMSLDLPSSLKQIPNQNSRGIDAYA